MIKDVLENIGGIGLYGVISICLFFAVFTGMLIWVFLLKKNYIKEMSELPLLDDPHADHSPEKDSKTQSPDNSQTDSNHE
jgi:hypothetical protein